MFSVDPFIIGLQRNHIPMSFSGIIIPSANDLKAESGPFGQQEYGTNMAAWISEILWFLSTTKIGPLGQSNMAVSVLNMFTLVDEAAVVCHFFT
nr:subtilisin-like protease SBT2.2 [Tanacetum cinerariifolium]